MPPLNLPKGLLDLLRLVNIFECKVRVFSFETRLMTIITTKADIFNRNRACQCLHIDIMKLSVRRFNVYKLYVYLIFMERVSSISGL